MHNGMLRSQVCRMEMEQWRVASGECYAKHGRVVIENSSLLTSTVVYSIRFRSPCVYRRHFGRRSTKDAFCFWLDGSYFFNTYNSQLTRP